MLENVGLKYSLQQAEEMTGKTQWRFGAPTPSEIANHEFIAT